MQGLPNHLSQWSEILQCFPEDITAVIQKIARQLSPMIGPLSIDQLSGHTEPEGVSGLSTKGNYERLLLSEWALHTHFPEEFIRRAASHEHLFIELNKVEPAAAKLSYALLDCGPEQLGRPRVVQLALLILLARRAEKSQAVFKWCVLQDDSNIWFEQVNQETIKQWLSQRSMQLASTDMLAAKLEQVDIIPDDIWLISQEVMTHPKTSLQRIAISEPLFEENKIEVAVHSRSFNTIKQLHLKNHDVLTRIIRNPFEEKKRASISDHWDSGCGWAIGQNGRQVAFRSHDNKIKVYRIPNSEKQKTTIIHQFTIPDKQVLVGVHLAKRGLSVLTYDEKLFYYHNFPGKIKIRESQRMQSVKGFNDQGRLQKIVISSNHANHGEHRHCLFINDISGKLRKKDLNQDDHLFNTIDSDIVKMEQLVNCEYSASYIKATKVVSINWYLTANSPSKRSFKVNLQRAPKIFSHGDAYWHSNQIGCMAIERDIDEWLIIIDNKETILTTKGNHTVLGVLPFNKLSVPNNNLHDKKACLITIDSGKSNVYSVTEGNEELLFSLSSELIIGELNPRLLYLHYMNDKNEFIAVSLLTGNELMKLGDL